MNIDGTVLCSSKERIIMNWCVIIYFEDGPVACVERGRRGSGLFFDGCLHATYLLATCCCVYLALRASTIVYAGKGGFATE